jgi:hypothetical protein
MKMTAEQQRLKEHRDRKANWKKWGPYPSERSWGTVHEVIPWAGHVIYAASKGGVMFILRPAVKV